MNLQFDLISITQGRITRFPALAHALGQVEQPGCSPRITTARITLRCLAEFVKQQFDFFSKGFALQQAANSTEAGDNFSLKKDPLFTPLLVLEMTLEQAMHDMELLLRTIGQRTEGVTTPEMRKRLDLADKLAHMAFEPIFASTFQQNQIPLQKRPTPLTYFDKSAIIRTFPYAPVAPIGVPLKVPLNGDSDEIRDSYRDLLTIPHEAGHRIFWYGAIFEKIESASAEPDKAKDTFGELVRSSLPDDTPQWIDNWFSEIFADVYSCLVAGPVVAHSIQSLMQKHSPGRFPIDDGHHPASSIRPSIYIETLLAMAAALAMAGKSDESLRLQNAACVLDCKWQQVLDDLKIPGWIVLANDGGIISLEAARKYLRKTIEALLETDRTRNDFPFLGQLLPGNSQHEMWSDGLATTDQDVEVLYEQMETWINSNSVNAVQLRELELVEENLVKFSATPESIPFEIGKTGLPFEMLRDSVMHGEAPPEITSFDPWWLQVLVGGAWTSDPGPANVRPPTTISS